MIELLSFIIGLSFLIIIHELGHFLVAKKSGVWVEEFGIGYPPRLFGKKIGETIYSVNLLPFGGFVRLHGESVEEGIKDKSRAFLHKSKKTRIAIIVAGVVMNLLLAVIIFSSIYTYSGIPKNQETGRVEILATSAGSPADVAGLQANDIVLSVDAQFVTSSDQFVDIVEERKGEELTLHYKREQETIKTTIIPRIDHPENEGPLGVVITSSEIVYKYPPVWQRPFIGAYYGIKEAIIWGSAILIGIFSMIKGLFFGIVPKDVAGPIGLGVLYKETAKFGIIPQLNLLAIVSINLAIINILPIPAVDGGRLFFILLEKITKRRVQPKVESIIHMVGFVVLILLLLAVSFKEINTIRLVGLDGYLESFGVAELQ